MSENIKKDTTINVQDAIAKMQESNAPVNANHGDIVTGDDGISGVVIDKRVVSEQSKDPLLSRINNMIESRDKMIASMENGMPMNAPSDFLPSQEDFEAEQKNLETLMNRNTNDAASYAESMKKLMEEAKTVNPMAYDNISVEKPTPVPNAPKPNIPVEAPRNTKPDVSTGVEDVFGNMSVPNSDVEDERRRTEAIAQEQIDRMSEIGQDTQNDFSNGEVKFDVPEGSVRSFISTLPISARDKITRTSSIVVNEVKKKTIPTSTRRITSMDEFKRIIPRKIHSEIVGVALVNSGIYATFKGAGSLAMATLMPDRTDKDGNPIRDYFKRYQFCYEYLVDTSIGKPSFNEFCAMVSVSDLDTCIYAILRASDPDENTITLVCGNEACQTEYDVKYSLSKLIDSDKITSEMMAEIQRIVSVKDVYTDAKKLHAECPINQIKTIDITQDDGSTISFELRRTTGSVIIERYPLMETITAKYTPFIFAFLLFIPKAYYTTQDGIVYEITSPEAIADLINDVDDDTLRAMSQVMSELEEFPSITYSFKGDYYCPKCRRHETRIPCSVDSLVFYKVAQAMR